MFLGRRLSKLLETDEGVGDELQLLADAGLLVHALGRGGATGGDELTEICGDLRIPSAM